MPVESVNYVQRENHNEIDDNEEHDDDEIAESATIQAEEICEMEYDNDDNDMSADNAASQAVKGGVKQGEGKSNNYDGGEAPKRLPNEVLDKIITFALTGTELRVITTFSSLSQLGDRIKSLASRYIRRLPRVSYSHKDIPSKSFHSMRKLCKEFGTCSVLVLALKKIIGNPKWINAWVELQFTGVGTWMYVTNIWWKGRE